MVRSKGHATDADMTAVKRASHVFAQALLAL
jgi:hypothetical protein